jgi:nucleoside phosphorylase
MDFNLKVIRELVNAALTAEELNDLLFDDFRSVYNTNKGEKPAVLIRELVEYADRKREITKLLGAIKKYSPNVYEEFKDKLYELEAESSDTTKLKASKAPVSAQVGNEQNYDPFKKYLEKLKGEVNDYLKATTNWIVPLQTEALAGARSKTGLSAFYKALGPRQKSSRPRDNFNDIFKEYDERLMLLGEPGSGKTILLFKYALEAIENRLIDAKQPLPIILMIATWDFESFLTRDDQTLANWIVEIYSEFGLSTIEQVLRNGEALLLLDGLDELARPTLDEKTGGIRDLKAIFMDRVIPKNNRVLVTCRMQDYQELGTPLPLNGPIKLCQLDDDAFEHLLSKNPHLQALFDEYPELRQIPRNPLILSLLNFVTSQSGKDISELRGLSYGEILEKIIEKFVDTCYETERAKIGEEKNQNLPSLESLRDMLGTIAMADAGGAGNKNTFTLSQISRYIQNYPEDDISKLVECACLLQLMIYDISGSLRFMHMVLRDHFAFEHAMKEITASDSRKRDSATWALWEIPDKRALKPLILALKDKNKYVRGNAASALGKIADPCAIEPLRQLLTDETPVVSLYGNRICDVAAAALKAFDNAATAKAEDTPGKDPLKKASGSSPQNEQSVLKGANVGGSVNIGSIHQSVNHQNSGTGGVNIGGNVSGTLIVTGSGNHIVTGTQQAPTSARPSNSSPSNADVLLVTVTTVETRAVFDHAKERTGKEAQRVFEGNKTYYNLGIIGGSRTWLVRSEMGLAGPGGALLTVADGIRVLSPDAVIMVGIAFGVDQDKQPIGKVLVSRQILDYDLQKVGTASDGTMQIRIRGDRPQASPRLLDRLRDGEFGWNGSEPEFGLMLSGPKLIDNLNFRDRLLEIEPEAIGGEMEGAGLYAAAVAQKVDWIMVKAVCDYADGHKRENKEERQKLAAQNAAGFVFHVIAQGGLVGARRLDP